jgi:hypothetical protein
MARVKPLDLGVVQAWLAAWDENDVFSDASVRHLQSLITDPFCLVVVTLGVGREPRSLVFRRVKQMIPVLIPPLPALKPSGKPAGVVLRQLTEEERTARGYALAESKKRQGEEGIRWPAALPEMIVSPVAPVAPSIGQLWHQTSVKSEAVPKREMVLGWDGTEWVIAGLVSDNATIMKQGKWVCGIFDLIDEQSPPVLQAFVEFSREWHRTGRGPKHRDVVREVALEYVEQRLAEAREREQRLLEGITVCWRQP